MKYYFTFYAFLLLFVSASPAQDDCCLAFQMQDNSSLSFPSSAGNGTPETLNGCSCLATNEHDSFWLSFECTTSGTFEMMITPAGLGGDFDFALYANECPCGSNTSVVSCNYTGPITPPGPFFPTGISSNPTASFGPTATGTEWESTVNLTAGTIYYIIADNITSNGVGFDIEFAGTAGIGPVPVSPGGTAGPAPIVGDLTICPGGTGQYAVTEIPTFGNYNWTVNPPIATINDNGNSAISIDWTVETTYDLCVTASAGCETTEPTCVTVNVQSIAPTVVEDEICLGDSYTFDGNGATYFTPGLFNITLTTPQGCDSAILLNLSPLLPTQSFDNTTFCNGDCFDFNGVEICETGTYSVTLTNFVGCDSIASMVAVQVITEPIVTPDPPDMIDCVNSSVFLDGSSSVSFTNIVNYDWYDSNGFLVGSGPIYEAIIGGDYTLIIEDEEGCTGETTVTVFEDPTDPEAFADATSIDCDNLTSFLTGNSTAFNPIYEWSGPNGFISFDQNPTTTDVGFYTLIITALNGCTAETTVEVLGDTQEPDVTADGGNIDCNNLSIFLNGSSFTPGVIYEWSGPNGFSDFTQNPNVIDAGIYNLTVTAPNGCTAETSAEVIGDFEEPDISANGNSLDCNSLFVNLEGNSNTPNVTYQWTGPSNFYSEDPVTPANEVGVYTLLVTGANGCTAETTAEIIGNMDIPEVTALGGTVDCISMEINLMGSSTTPDVTYAWTGPNGFSSDLQNPPATDPGDYTLVVTAPNGCSATEVAIIVDNSELPDIATTGGTLTCNDPNLVITGSSTTPDVTYAWSGPNNFSSDVPNPEISEMGDYTLVITAPNGCTVSEIVPVPADQNMPDISADGGALDCNNLAINLSGNSITPDVSFAWEGPNNFSSIEQNPEITESGNYTLTIIATNGCEATQSVTVTADFDEPDIQTMGATIDCNNPDVEISGNTTIIGATYSWTGPNGFMSDIANPIVSEEGAYTLVILGTNGCSSMMDAFVDTDLEEPEIAVTGGILTCASPTFTLSSNSPTPDITYSWAGPNGFVSDDPSPEITDEGVYILTITAQNGCIAQDTAQILQDADIPEVSLEGGILTCADSTLEISTTTNNPDLAYTWTGPNGFSSDNQNPMVSVSGIYEVNATALNGCSTSQEIEISEDFIEPEVSATGGIITCSESMISIDGLTSTPGATISWTGPGGFTSDENQPTVSEIGDYTITATGTNGCIATAIATVEADADLPEVGVIGGTLNCDVTEIQIQSNSSNPDVTYSWTGPNGYISDEQNPMISVAGSYILVVSTATDCSASATAVIEEDIAQPDIVLENGLINCDETTAILTTVENSVITNYAWTGPNSFTSDEANPEVAEGGIYELVAMGQNGCTIAQTLEIIEDTIEPDISATAAILDCNSPTILLEGNTLTPDAIANWTGPNGFTADELQPEIAEGGEYTLLITGTNGCTSSEILIVEEDFIEPDIVTENGLLDCGITTLILTANSNTPDLNYNWTEANGFESMEANPEINAGGDYLLVVTAQNGCTNSATAIILEDFVMPDIQAAAGTLTCLETEITLAGNSDTPNVNYSWTGPNGFTSDEANPITNVAGDYTLIITGENSCTSEASVIVNEDIASPNISVAGGILNCDMNSLIINGNSNTPNVTYSWETPDGQTLENQNPQVALIGDYILTVTAQNGCTSSATATVEQDVDVPDIEAIGGIINCNNPDLVLSGNSNTGGVEYSWEAPNGTEINEQNPTISEGGNYILTITAPNGCTASAVAEVIPDFATPDISTTGGIISCDNPEVQISGSSNTSNVTYLWIGPNGFVSEEQMPVTDEPGNYALIITAENGCTSTEMAIVELDADVPIATADGGTLTCLIDEVILTGGASVPNVDYSWEGPNGFNSTLQNPVVGDAGNYTLTITADNGCSNSITAIVDESFDLPNIEILAPDEFLCNTESVVIDASSSDGGAGFMINWTTANGEISNGANTLTPTISLAGIYTIEITNNNNGCVASQEIEVTQNEDLPTDAIVNFTNPSCFGENDGLIEIESVVGGQPPFRYSLNGSDFVDSPQFTFLTGGNFDITIIDAGGCEFSTQVVLEEPIELNVDLELIGGNNRVNLGEIFQLDAQVNIPTSQIDSIMWSPANSIPANCQNCLNPEIIAINSQTFDVTVIDENGCIASDFISVIVNQERPVYVPNVFSPNGDGFNDELYIFGGASVVNIKSFQVFNRWGEVVYSYFNFPPNNFGLGWDGTHRGQKLRPDVFIFMAEVEFIDGKIEVFKGDVTIIK